MGTEFETARAAAVQAYIAEYRKHGVNFAAPVTQMKDRVWSEILRATWPDYQSVDVKTYGQNKPSFREMRDWCNGQPSAYWVNGGGSRWYFERRDIAALFKLTFGGAQ